MISRKKIASKKILSQGDAYYGELITKILLPVQNKWAGLLKRDKGLSGDLAMIKGISDAEDQDRYLHFKFVAACNDLK